MSENALFSAAQIGDWFIAYARIKGQTLTAKKFQKLLYFAWAEYSLIDSERDLFDDEIIAGKYGPLIQSTWEDQKETAIDLEGGANEMVLNRPVAFSAYGKTNEFLIKLWNTYGQSSGSDLEEITHKEAPWRFTRPENPEGVISKALIRGYYRIRPKVEMSVA